MELASRSEPLPVFCPDLAKASLRIGIVWVNYNQDSRRCEWADSRSPTPECLEDRDPGGKSGYDNISNESLPGLFANRRSVPQVRSKVDFGLQACDDGLSGSVSNPAACRRDKYEQGERERPRLFPVQHRSFLSGRDSRSVPVVVSGQRRVTSGGQGADLLEKRGWEGLSERVMAASYS